MRACRGRASHDEAQGLDRGPVGVASGRGGDDDVERAQYGGRGDGGCPPPLEQSEREGGPETKGLPEPLGEVEKRRVGDRYRELVRVG